MSASDTAPAALCGGLRRAASLTPHPRFRVEYRVSEEDLRLKSIFDVATDWPLKWSDLERYYCAIWGIAAVSDVQP
jgi:hypothetical protein